MSLHDHEWDVIVAGGGIAGCMAAVAAARNGAKTLLVERDGCLGGTMTNGLVGPMMTFHSAKEQVVRGLAQEVVDRLMEIKASPGHILDSTGYVETVTPFDHEGMKIVLQRMVLESGATVLLHTWVENVVLEGSTIRGIVVQNKGGQDTLYAKIVIDASGDGDIAALAGVPFQLGRPTDSLVQPVSLMFKMTDVNLSELKTYLVAHPEIARLGDRGASIYNEQDLIAVCAFNDQLQQWIETHHLHLQREHVLVFSANNPDDLIVNMTRVQEVNPLDAWDLTKAELEAREQLVGLVDFLISEIPGFEKARLIKSGSRIGVRESRRINGEYTLTAEDILASRHFDDAIARSAYPIDIHSLNDNEEDKNVFLEKGSYYEIPYRCLVPLKIENLLIAGRCLSTTYEASASTRVSPNCMEFGQAAGTAAALSFQQGVTPRRLDTSLLRQVLITQKAFL
jgi:Dehydrogenases (flavoproteins)